MIKTPDYRERFNEFKNNTSQAQRYESERFEVLSLLYQREEIGRSIRNQIRRTASQIEITERLGEENAVRQIRILLYLQSRILRDILRIGDTEFEDKPKYQESGRALFDSNCHQTAAFVLGQDNYWGRMRAITYDYDHPQSSGKVNVFGLPNKDESSHDIVDDPQKALAIWEGPIHVTFSNNSNKHHSSHSAVLLKATESGKDFLCFEQPGFSRPVRYNYLSNIAAEWGQSKFIRPKS